MATKVVVHTVPEQKFTQAVIAGRHVLNADEPQSAGGADLGPNPYEYLLAALGT